MNAIGAMLTRLDRSIAGVVKNAMQSIPSELSAFTGDFMKGPDDKTGMRKAKSGNLYYTERNRSKKLRTLYGNLQRAITPGEIGNVSHVTDNNGVIETTFGIDTSARVKAGTRTTTLEYGKINEQTRPFISKGFQEYYTSAEGYRALLKEIENAIIEIAENA